MSSNEAKLDDASHVVVCVRWMDASNDFTVFDDPKPDDGDPCGGVAIFDIDMGYMDLGIAEEYDDWKRGHLEQVARLRSDGWREVARYIYDLVIGQAPSDYAKWRKENR